MDLKISGTVEQVLDEQSGTGKNGPWRKQEFILKTTGQYPKQVCITQWGDNIDQFDVKEGESITAFIDIQSREYNGRWYTDVKAWKIERGEESESKDIQLSATGDEDSPDSELPDMDDDLPF